MHMICNILFLSERAQFAMTMLYIKSSKKYWPILCDFRLCLLGQLLNTFEQMCNFNVCQSKLNSSLKLKVTHFIGGTYSMKV